MSRERIAADRDFDEAEDSLSSLVSVVIPCYNRAGMIEEALESVADQTYRPIEVIVVDDGSTDDSAKVVRQWAAANEDSDLQVELLEQENAGAQAARNRGYRASEGAYIQFLDSDDRLRPHKLKRQVHLLEDRDLDYVYGKTEYLDPDGHVQKVGGEPRSEGPWIALHAWSTSSPLFKRRVCEEVGPWEESLAGCHEYEFAARVKAAGFRGHFMDTVVDQHRSHGNASITRREYQEYGAAVEMAAEQILELIPEEGRRARVERNRVARNLCGCAFNYARNGDETDAKRCLRRAEELARGPFALPITLVARSASMTSLQAVLGGARRLAKVARKVGLNI